MPLKLFLAMKSSFKKLTTDKTNEICEVFVLKRSISKFYSPKKFCRPAYLFSYEIECKKCSRENEKESFSPHKKLWNSLFTVPCRKTRFFPTQITKLAVAPIISKIHKQYVPHWKDLKLSFKFWFQTFKKTSRLKSFSLNFKSSAF